MHPKLNVVRTDWLNKKMIRAHAGRRLGHMQDVEWDTCIERLLSGGTWIGIHAALCTGEHEKGYYLVGR